jgi:hypothetical protein
MSASPSRQVESRERILAKFLAAMSSGDRKGVMALLAEKSNTFRRRQSRGRAEDSARAGNASAGFTIASHAGPSA